MLWLSGDIFRLLVLNWNIVYYRDLLRKFQLEPSLKSINIKNECSSSLKQNVELLYTTYSKTKIN